MRIIYCNLQLFSYDQMIYIYENNEEIYSIKVDIEEVIPTICALAQEHGITQVKLHGQNVYTHAWADQLKTAYALNYGNKNIDVEVI